MAERILMSELKALQKEKWVNVETKGDNLLIWNVALLILNPDSLYHGGYFEAKMTFPTNYPYSPPTFRFLRPLTHPNIYADGRLCISILHAPGEDELSGETAGERWSPVQRVESVLLSILSLLDDAECSSPANVDAGVLLRKEPEKYAAQVRRDVETSRADMPADFEMPRASGNREKELAAMAEREKDKDDRDFWVDSEEENGFGGSDTDEWGVEDEEAEDEDEELLDSDLDEEKENAQDVEIEAGQEDPEH